MLLLVLLLVLVLERGLGSVGSSMAGVMVVVVGREGWRSRWGRICADRWRRRVVVDDGGLSEGENGRRRRRGRRERSGVGSGRRRRGGASLLVSSKAEVLVLGGVFWLKGRQRWRGGRRSE